MKLKLSPEENANTIHNILKDLTDSNNPLRNICDIEYLLAGEMSSYKTSSIGSKIPMPTYKKRNQINKTNSIVIVSAEELINKISETLTNYNNQINNNSKYNNFESVFRGIRQGLEYIAKKEKNTNLELKLSQNGKKDFRKIEEYQIIK